MAGSYKTTNDDVVNKDFIAGTITVGTTEVAVRVGGSNLSQRQEITIFNSTSNTIWYGPSGITASDTGGGIPITSGEVISLQYGPDVDVYLIAAQVGNTITIHEAS